jgi:hypothetical protein
MGTKGAHSRVYISLSLQSIPGAREASKIGHACQHMLVHACVVHRCIALPINEVSVVAPSHAPIAARSRTHFLLLGKCNPFVLCLLQAQASAGPEPPRLDVADAPPASDGASPPLSTPAFPRHNPDPMPELIVLRQAPINLRSRARLQCSYPSRLWHHGFLIWITSDYNIGKKHPGRADHRRGQTSLPSLMSLSLNGVTPWLPRMVNGQGKMCRKHPGRDDYRGWQILLPPDVPYPYVVAQYVFYQR